MLKEKLYFEYRSQYNDYTKKHKNVDDLNQKLTDLKDEYESKKTELSNENKEKVSSLKNERETLRKKLQSVKKYGIESDVVKEFSNNKIQEMEHLKGVIADYNEDIAETSQKIDSLNSVINNASFEEFDEEGIIASENTGKDALIQESYQRVQNRKNEISAAIDNFPQAFEREYNVQKNIITNDNDAYYKYQMLLSKYQTNSLPPAIVYCMSYTPDEIIYNNKINSGEDIRKKSENVKYLDELANFAPGLIVWFVKYGLSIFLGLLFCLIWIRGGEWYWVSDTAGGLATFIVRILVAALVGAIGSLIFFLLSYIGLGIFRMFSTKVAAIIGAVIGFVITLFLFTGDISIEVDSTVASVITVILKIIICSAITAVLCLIITNTDLCFHIINLFLKIKPLKNIALKNQEYIVGNNAIYYAILLKHEEILWTLIKNRQDNYYKLLQDEWNNLDGNAEIEVQTIRDSFEKKINLALKNKRADYDNRKEKWQTEYANNVQNYNDLVLHLNESTEKLNNAKIKLNNLSDSFASDKDTVESNLLNEIKKCDTDLEKTAADFEELSEKNKKSYQKSKAETEKKIDNLEKGFEPQREKMHEIFRAMNENTVGFEESKGILSDYICLFNENPNANPVKIYEVKHDKKPIVFLYDIEESTNITQSLFNFMRAVLAGFYIMNSKDVLEVIIADPVSKGRKFEQQAEQKLLSIQNDIRLLSESVDASMRKVSATGFHIDDYNRKMYDEGEDKVKYFKYKIVEFIVPEESAAQNTNFFDSDLWGTLGDGSSEGFIPIFYISYRDWVDTMSEESKLNSKFIRLLKDAIGKNNGQVFKIDVDNVSIEKVNIA